MEKLIKCYEPEYQEYLRELQVIHLHKIEEIPAKTILPVNLEDLSISNTLTCSCCNKNFDDSLEQRQHYKSDWHRYNLKLNLKGVKPLTEDQFEKLQDDVSSISGSDSEESDSEDDKSFNHLYQGKLYLLNQNTGVVLSIFRALIHEKKNAPETSDLLCNLVKLSPKKNYWTILMIGGGHFAGAVFEGKDVLVHKTFHLYTCRARQGGAQYKEGGARSAGASLRRYNEQSLNQRVAELLENWAQQIEKSHLIFYRAAGPFNRKALFGAKDPVIKKTDPRLRSIPFCTKRPTFTELKRVHDILTNVEIYPSIESIKNMFLEPAAAPPKDERGGRSPQKNKNINRAKSRESKENIRPLPGAPEGPEAPETSEDDEEVDLMTEQTEINFGDLNEFEGTKKPPAKKSKIKKKDRIKKWEDQFKRDLFDCCIKGNLPKMEEVLSGLCPDQQITPNQALNYSIDVDGNTVLHLAALNNHNEMITWLLENDSSPCMKNNKNFTPYTINQDKSVRRVFRDFAALHPDKYNYQKSQIPVISELTAEQQALQNEKKKAQRKAKRDREKEKRVENKLKQAEEDERNRFIKLSDREKRALAAERRLLAQNSSVFVRCFLCGEDISGKVPFEYGANRFCSISCLKAHRMQNPILLQ